MYAFIGIGQGGTSLADLASSKQFPALSINYSKKDLDSCRHIPPKMQLHLYGTEGVGKNRSYAKELFSTNYEKTITFIKQHLEQPSIDIIFVIYSTAGGTGSGIAPMIIDLINMEMTDKAIVACPILPDLEECLTSQLNALDCLHETLKVKGASYLFIDNQSISSKHLHKTDKYKQINSKVLNQLIFLLECTSKESLISNLDRKDLKALFSTDGVVNIGDLHLTNPKELTMEWIKEGMIKSLKTSLFSADYGNNLSKIGMVVNGNADLFKKTDLMEFVASFKYKPTDIFEGYYEGKCQRIAMILTGLSPELLRVAQIKEVVESQQITNVDDNLNYERLFSIENRPIAPSKPKKVSPLEILSKYS